MGPSKSSHSPGEVVQTRTTTPSESKDFTWRIANFGAMFLEGDRSHFKMHSTTFKMGDGLGLPTEWRCELKRSGGRIACKVTYAKGSFIWRSSVVFKGEIRVGNKTMKMSNSRRRSIDSGSEYSVTCPIACVPWTRFLRRVAAMALPLEKDGSLCIHIHLEFTNKDKRKFTSGPGPVPVASKKLSDWTSEFEGRFREKLYQDLKALYEKPCGVGAATPATIPGQVKMVARDGKEFPAQAFMLAARSPVFRAMFTTPMTEMRKGVVHIDDVGGDALEVLLHFLHLGELKASWRKPGILEGLAYAAHKYMIPDLLEFLDQTMALVVKPKNLTACLHLAVKIDLKKAAQEMFPVAKQNLMKEIQAPESIVDLLSSKSRGAK